MLGIYNSHFVFFSLTFSLSLSVFLMSIIFFSRTDNAYLTTFQLSYYTYEPFLFYSNENVKERKHYFE